MLGGGTAAAAHGLRAVGGNDPYRRGGADGPCSRVVVLVPHRVRRADTGFVTLARTTRFPEPAILVDGLATCPLTRAVVDACLSLHDIRSVRALVAEAVQRGFTTVDRITPELAAAPSAGSALIRRVLREVDAGVRSAPEAELRQLLRAARIPEPTWNPDLYGPGGRWLGRPDAWWPEAGVAYEVDSREWHLSPDGSDHTMRKHNRMESAGIMVLHASPTQLRSEPAAVIAEIRSAYAAGRQRGPAPGVVAGSQRAAS